jgi:hypothetical protein
MIQSFGKVDGRPLNQQLSPSSISSSKSRVICGFYFSFAIDGLAIVNK